jgi:hypothetical protein
MRRILVQQTIKKQRIERCQTADEPHVFAWGLFFVWLSEVLDRVYQASVELD